ncbi:MAG: tRNA (adenosine(37)-N6)-threonylcarbamoyltransferase complex ATPase subunit type 1 TsaE [Alphaproteobacteria bacterium]|nr:tRNA (adenosine(37)-N6)-threonylcarbamoyltransferase complex ATPase subunit type 1 TsaE [Alphaproteobacteria bacterium]
MMHRKSFTLISAEQTTAMAIALAGALQGGEFISLSGELGTGKSHFARAAIRALVADPELEVPSPSFTLVQSYIGQNSIAIHHCDLYRLGQAQEIFELGLEPIIASSLSNNAESAIYFVEWPQVAAQQLRKAELELEFTFTAATQKRKLHASGSAALIQALSNYES